jgi:serine/threonine protein kinase
MTLNGMHIAPGTMIGRYRVEDVLESLVVHDVQMFKCADPDLKRSVVVHLSKLRLDDRLEAGVGGQLSAYHQKLRRLAHVRHPNVTNLYDYGQMGGHPYHVMEFVVGRPLANRLNLEPEISTSGQVSVGVMLHISALVAGALHYLHRAGVVHGDVRPENIILRPTGDPVLVGFDLAFATEQASEGSPEEEPKVAPAGPCPKDDLVGLGRILAAGCLGRALTEEEQTASVIKATLQPPFVADIVARCMARVEDGGYASTDEAKRAMEAAIDHLELQSGDMAAQEPPRRGQNLLLHAEYHEATDLGSYREYKIKQHLNEGAFGDVYEAVDLLAARPVALKILKQRWVSEPETVVRFRREAIILSRLAHRNIIRVYTFGRYGTSFFIAMELLDGPTLLDTLKLWSPLPMHEAVDLTLQILAGIEVIHGAGVVHRDLKPENIKVQQGRVVVFDFGISHDTHLHPLTRSGAFVGTPHYAAPEQVAGEPAVPASDVFAVGVMLYEMLTGVLPHASKTRPSAGGKVPVIPAPSGEERFDKLPEGVTHVIKTFMADDPKARPSAREAALLLASTPLR